QILDRGLTISNLIGFYYGRNPNTFQQDTVLQHSRMYGVRPKEDLTVTRFYTTAAIYSVMQTIHEFDAALRAAFETGGQEAGVVFLRTDSGNRIVPCSPNKILLSSTTTLRPKKRLLPIGFQTKGKSVTQAAVRRIDDLLSAFEGDIADGRAFLIDLDLAKDIVDAIADSLEFEETSLGWDVPAFKAAMVYLSRSNADGNRRERLWCLVRKDRGAARKKRLGDRFENAPDTKQEQDVADGLDGATPLLMLLRERGSKAQGWNDCPFWWPVLQAPRNTKTVIFASEMND
ncbi:MAG: Z1 domain-containing protein, partial [Candidatus Saccharimonadales bacterium]